MIKVKRGDVSNGRNAVYESLDRLFVIPFMDVDVMLQIVELQDKVTAIRKEYKDVFAKIIEAHGQENSEGKKMIAMNHPAIEELNETEVEIKLNKIKLKLDDIRATGVPLSANNYINLRDFVIVDRDKAKPEAKAKVKPKKK